MHGHKLAINNIWVLFTQITVSLTMAQVVATRHTARRNSVQNNHMSKKMCNLAHYLIQLLLLAGMKQPN